MRVAPFRGARGADPWHTGPQSHRARRVGAWSTALVPLRPTDVGHRVVVRHRLLDGRATDVLGELVSLDDAALRVRRADGAEVVVPRGDVVAARPVPPPPARRRARALGVEDAARRTAWGWAPAEEVVLGDWRLRSSPGRVWRGRSVLAVGDPGLPLPAAVVAVTAHYAALGMEPVVQVASPLPGAGADDEGRAAALEGELARRGWRPDPWSVLALQPLARAGAPAGAALRVELSGEPSAAWLAASDRRGAPLEPRDLPPPRTDVATAYASAVAGVVVDGAAVDGAAVDGAAVDGAVVAVARGAVAGGWLGLSCVHVAPGARRRGAARSLLGALTAWGAAAGAGTAYVQVVAANAPARALWAAAGFADHSRYRFWHPAT